MPKVARSLALPRPHRKNSNNTRPPYLRLLLALGLVSLLALAIFNIGVFAQFGGRADAEAAFAAKADKLLRNVRRVAIADREAEQQGRPRGAASELQSLSRVAGVRRAADGTITVSITVSLTNNSDAELKAAGFAVGARVGDMATVETEVDRLPELAALASVNKIKAATFSYPKNDRARREIGVDNSSGQRTVSQTGRGVVVGIIDTGIDFHHRDFTVPGSNGTQTRIKALLDMTVYTTTTADWNYSLPGQTARIGHFYSQADINAALQGSGSILEKDKAGHGTHVAGTAAGNGLSSPTPGTYAGMAPEADLIIVKASRQNDGTDNFGTNDILNALSFIKQKAAELGEPFVINMSLGGHGGSPHDGTDPEERAVDSLVGAAPGRVVCIAAGNEGGAGIHASGNVTQGGNVALTVTAPATPQTFTLYYANTDRLGLTVTLPNGSTLNAGAFNGNPASNQYLTIYNGTDDKQDSDPSNDQSSLFITFDQSAQQLGQNWTFTLQGNSIGNGHFDAWVDDGRFNAPYVDDSRLVGSPGTSRGALTVGAYVTRSASQTVGNYASFTSPGPTADGRQKPDVSAPGYYLYSSRSADVGSEFGTIGTGSNAPTDSTHYTGLAGTSMATPVTTGAVALMLQLNPSLTSAQIKSFISTNAAHDGFDSPGYNAHFGFGKLNIAAAITAAGGSSTPTNQIDSASFFVGQHYQDFLGRTADAGGLQYWSEQISGNSSNTPPPCAAGDARCEHVRRISVSAAFFVENEFQRTGGFVYRFYKASYGTRPTFTQFKTDRAQVYEGDGLEARKQAFAANWVQRPEFIAKYPASLSSTAFVDALLQNVQQNSGVDLSGQRASLLNDYTAGGRAQVVRSVADNATLQQAEYNAAFVLMQYFGYLQRNPDDGGYQFWLGILNDRVPNNYRAMVCAFITSTEYQQRFGSAITRSNADCAFVGP